MWGGNTDVAIIYSGDEAATAINASWQWGRTSSNVLRCVAAQGLVAAHQSDDLAVVSGSGAPYVAPGT